jgi:hypothetical protein
MWIGQQRRPESNSRHETENVWPLDKGTVNLIGCGQRDAHCEVACGDYPAEITLLISAHTSNLCVLAALCSAAVM